MVDDVATSDDAWPDAFEESIRLAVPALGAGARILPDTQLFDLGLDSLAAVELISRVEELFDIRFDEELSDPDLLATPGDLWAAARLRMRT